MNKKIRQLQSDFRLFRETRYRKDYLLHLFIILTVSILTVCAGILLFRLAPSHINAGMIRAFAVCAIIIMLILIISCTVSFYHVIVKSALRIEEIRSKYSLIDSEKMVDYTSALNTILDLIDSSLDREYSNSLLQKQAQLDAMQSQINPHFLYNTLDTIRGYAVIENAPITSDMVEVLSRLFRYMISQKIQLVTLRQELSILQDYIKIMEYRVNRKITFIEQIETDQSVMNYKIPKLIIQPFVENALKHGLEGNTKDFIITLHIFRSQSRLIISVKDNGKGMTTEQLKKLNTRLLDNDVDTDFVDKESKQGSGIALTNVNARIRLLYGKSYGVTAYSTLGEGSEFQLTLPY